MIYFRNLHSFYRKLYVFDKIGIPSIFLLHIILDCLIISKVRIMFNISNFNVNFKVILALGVLLQLYFSLIINRILWVIKETFLDWYDTQSNCMKCIK